MRWLVVFALAACRPGAPEPLVTPHLRLHPYDPPTRVVPTRVSESEEYLPPPPISVLDVLPAGTPVPNSTRLAPPSMEPHWAPAATPDLCSDLWSTSHHNDVDAKGYAAAWCRIRKQDRSALDALGKLAVDGRPDVASAARLDVLNLVSDWMPAPRALEWLDALSLGTAENLDVLANSYAAFDLHEDATFTASVAVARDARDALPRCERSLQTAQLDDKPFLRFAHDRSDCGRLVERIACQVGFPLATSCFDDKATKADPLWKDKLAVYYAVTNWNQASWIYVQIAGDIDPFLSVRGGEELVVRAVENGLRVPACRRQDRDALAYGATRLRHTKGHSQAFDDRLDRVIVAAAAPCR